MTARISLVAATAAAGLVAVLVGGSATYAAWTATAEGGTATIIAGDLQAEITQSGPTTVRTGSSAGVYPVADSQGIIPGVQAQQWTYSLANVHESATGADATLRLRGDVRDVSDYTAIRPYLRGTVEVEGRELGLPESAFGPAGLDHDVDLGVSLAPGESVSVVLTLSMPASVTDPNGRTIDVAVATQNHRSASTAHQPIFTMTNSVLLHQAAAP